MDVATPLEKTPSNIKKFLTHNIYFKIGVLVIISVGIFIASYSHLIHKNNDQASAKPPTQPLTLKKKLPRREEVIHKNVLKDPSKPPSMEDSPALGRCNLQAPGENDVINEMNQGDREWSPNCE